MRGRETSGCGCLSHTPHWGLACNPVMCPDWELNQGPFGSQAGAQSMEPYQPGLYALIFKVIKRKYIKNGRDFISPFWNQFCCYYNDYKLPCEQLISVHLKQPPILFLTLVLTNFITYLAHLTKA